MIVWVLSLSLGEEVQLIIVIHDIVSRAIAFYCYLLHC